MPGLHRLIGRLIDWVNLWYSEILALADAFPHDTEETKQKKA